MSLSLPDLHKILSRVDVTKDACAKPINIASSALFNLCADKLFDKMNSYIGTKAQITEIINNTVVSPDISFKISDIKHSDNIYITSALPFIKYGTQDSGLSPCSIIDDITLIITPGSIIDACDRTKKSKNVYYGLNGTLNSSLFKQIGFDNIKKLQAKTDSKNILLQLDFSFGKSISIITDLSLNIIAGDYKYIKGNETKNLWFSEQKTITDANIIEGYLYILCKELGDTLQAVYTRLFMNSNKINNNVCLFTTDKHLQLRCKLLNVPVIIKNYKKDLNDCIYYPIGSNMSNEMKYEAYNRLFAHNNSILTHINQTIKKGLIYINNRLIAINDKCKILLEKIYKSIYDYTLFSKTIDAKFIDYITYCDYINQFKAVHIASLKGDNYYLYDPICIFPNLKKDILNLDILKLNNKTLYELIDDIYNLSSKKVGGTTESVVKNDYSDIEEYLKKTDTYISDREYNPKIENSGTMIKRAIFVACRDKYIDATIAELFLITENIFNSIYNYFDSLQESCYNKEYISELIEYYNRDKSILDITKNEFIELFNHYRKILLKERKKEEDEIDLICEKFNNSSLLIANNDINIDKNHTIKKNYELVYGGLNITNIDKEIKNMKLRLYPISIKNKNKHKNKCKNKTYKRK